MFGLLVVVTLGFLCTFADGCVEGESEGKGIYLLGTRYNCSFLRQYHSEDKYIGIYEHRKFHCRQHYTDCCYCDHILSCIDAPVNGIYLAEANYDCSRLRQYYPEDEHVGIYMNRKSICLNPTTDCCESCEKVMNEKESTTTMSTASTPTPEPTTRGTQPPVVYQDTCQNDCLWIGDGNTGTCSWLLDRLPHKRSVYLCNYGFATGCQRTCNSVLSMSTSTKEAETTPAPLPVCEDTHIMFMKMSYSCSDLLNPASVIYSRRQGLCTSDSSACCVTCGHVKNEKSSGIIKYNDENEIDKSGDTILALSPFKVTNNVKLAAKSTSNKQTISVSTVNEQVAKKRWLTLFEHMKAYTENMKKERETQKKAFSLMINSIMSMFRGMT